MLQGTFRMGNPAGRKITVEMAPFSRDKQPAANLPIMNNSIPASPLSGIASLLQPFVDRNTLSGAVALVASKDAILSLDTVGFADLRAHKAMTPDALFWIASQTKPMTATAFMMLVDEGRISVDDPVEKYLPEFKGQMLAVEQDEEHANLRKPAHPITVREILNHTAGLPFSSPLELPTKDMLPLHIAVKSYAMSSLKTEPGTIYEYSNAGTNTVGRLIEVLSGVPYDEFMRNRLFRPLGMKDTTFVPNEEQVRRLARTYKPNSTETGLEEITIPQLHYPLTDPTRQPFPAGGLFSTAGDVARFCQMILNGGELGGKRYVSKDSVAQMTRKQTVPTVEKSYGLGWGTENGVFGHNGANSTNSTIDPVRGLITVFLVQHSWWHGDGGQAQENFKQAVRDWHDAGRP